MLPLRPVPARLPGQPHRDFERGFGGFGGTKVRQEAGAISRCKSDPGKAQPATWKRVLREPTATPATKRTQLLHGVCD